MKISNRAMTVAEIRQTQVEDSEVVDELVSLEVDLQQEAAETVTDLAESLEGAPRSTIADALENWSSDTLPADFGGMTEAIIERHGFPALLVQNGRYAEPRLRSWQRRLNPHRDIINTAISKVGRIELVRNGRAQMLATGWLLDEDTIITNRHVARGFSHIQRAGHPIKAGHKVRIDFLEEHDSDRAAEFGIDQVTFVDLSDRDVDLALLRLDRNAARRLSMEPISVKDGFDDVEFVGVIGYPAFDTRNSTSDQIRIFDDIFEVKRLSPGKIISDLRGRNAFQHNSTTLGGNSGSAVIDVKTGCAVGLHFGGREGMANFAVKPKAILDRAAQANVGIVPCGNQQAGGRRRGSRVGADSAGFETPTGGSPRSYSDRDGFDPHFLGDSGMTVPLPKLNRLQRADVAPVKGGGHVLNYRHFSVVMNAKRRLAYYAAVNIDGSQLWAFKRGRDRWVIDARIDEDHQVDNILYKGRHNDFDRGHVVRRLDPVWDDKDVATQAMEDTFHYTNALPQHKRLNRRIWLRLEEHILENTNDNDWKISVLAGPIFGPNDPVHKPTSLPVPRAFWKVIASTARRPRRKPVLQVQAFVLPQDHLIDHNDLEAQTGVPSEAIFGTSFETSQVTVAELERLTGLDFLNLREADTFGQPPDVDEVAESAGFIDLPDDRNYSEVRELTDVIMY